MPHDVLDHGVVDHEADGYRQRHQRQVVEAVAEHVKHSERADQQSGTVTAGMIVAQKFRRNRKMTITTSATVNIRVNWTSETAARMVAVRSAAIVTLIVGHRRLQCWQQRPDAIDGFDDIGARNPLDRE